MRKPQEQFSVNELLLLKVLVRAEYDRQYFSDLSRNVVSLNAQIKEIEMIDRLREKIEALLHEKF